MHWKDCSGSCSDGPECYGPESDAITLLQNATLRWLKDAERDRAHVDEITLLSGNGRII